MAQKSKIKKSSSLGVILTLSFCLVFLYAYFDLSSTTSFSVYSSGSNIALSNQGVVSSSKQTSTSTDTTISVNGKNFKAIVVDTEASREQGLSGRTSLAKDEAMLFVFQDFSIHGIWMKDMNFPIDVVWLDREARVIHTVSNMSPASYPAVYYPPSSDLYIIEFPEGTVDSLRLKLGDKVDMNFGK